MSIKKSLKYFAGMLLAAAPFLGANAAWQMTKANASGLEQKVNEPTAKVAPAPKIERPKLVVNKDKAATEESYKNKVIILDAGHGGKDPGAVNGDIHESDITLKQALKVKQILESRGYAQVILTRNSDQFVKLADRVEMAERYIPDIFVSIHCDSAVKKNKKGEFVTDPDARGFTCYQRKGVEDILLATPINEELDRELRRSKKSDNNRGVKNADYWVLGIKCPAVLAECGFLSNDLGKENDLAYMTDNIDDVETAIANGIELYLQLPMKIREKSRLYDSIIEQKTKEFSQRLGHELDPNLVRAVIFREAPNGKTKDPMQVATSKAYAYRILKEGEENTYLLGDFSHLKPGKLEDNIEAGVAWLFHKAAIYEERTVEGEKTETYTVQNGDNYYKIAKNKGTTVDTLKNLNPNIDPNKMIAGKTKLTVKEARKERYIKGWKKWEEAVRGYGPASKTDYADEVMEYWRMITERR
jgi:N-acetylmuramoyl-L-alanine amidase